MTDNNPERIFKFVPASTIKTEVIEWLMEAWLPRGKLTTMAGREGIGKSTIACDIVACGTVGKLDNGEPIKALYVATEDGWSDTVKPRLEAAGADLDMVGFLEIAHGEHEGALSLPGDFPTLEKFIESENIGLVVLDAAKSTMSSEINDHRDDDVRKFLEPMSRIADKHDCAFLALVHFGKRDGSDAGKLILGSSAWSQVPRSTIAVAQDRETKNLVVTNTKKNIAKRTRSEECHIVNVDIATDDGLTASVGRVEWLGETSTSAEDVLENNNAGGRGSRKPPASQQWLQDYLTDNPDCPAADAIAAGKDAGFSERAIERAAGEVAHSERKGFPARAVWNVKDGGTRTRGGTGATGATAPRAGESGGTGGTVSDLHKQNGGTVDDSPVPPVPPVTPTPQAHVATVAEQHSVTDTELRDIVYGALHPDHGIDARTVVGSFTKAYAESIGLDERVAQNILNSFTAIGQVQVDGKGRYRKAEAVA